VTRPGVEILSRAQPLARSAPTDTGVWFVVGAVTTEAHDGSGENVPTLITSMTQYEAVYGARGNGSAQKLYDAVETYFREGGARLYVSGFTATTPVASDFTDALDLFSETLGPGQVSAPGSTDVVVQTALLDHAASHNRVALIDGPASGDAASIVAAGAALTSTTNARYGAMFAPNAIIPGVAAGTTRSVSMAAVVAGIIARNDVSFTANQAAAGVNGVSLYANDLSAFYSDDDYQTINEAGICMARNVYGVIQNYGYRSLVDPDGADSAWTDFGHCRLNMQIVARAGVIAQRYLFSQIDGRKRTIADFGGELSGMLVPFYEAGALYGDTAQEAFNVNVGSQVNTEQTIANGELHAVLQVRMSPFAELVVIEIVKVSTTEALAAGAVQSVAQASAA